MLQQWKKVLDCLEQPAFICRDGEVMLANAAAQRIGLHEKTDLPEQLLQILPLVDGVGQSILRYAGQRWDVAVRPVEQMQLVFLREYHTDCNAQVLAAASRALRQPLQQMLVAASQLFAYLEEQENETIQTGTAALNRGMYQMLRAIGNLTDFGMTEETGRYHKKRTDCNQFFADFVRQVESLVESTGRQLSFQCQSRRFYAQIDGPAVERALLNILSNAIAHTPAQGQITLYAGREGKLCYVSVKNQGQPVSESDLVGIFDHYAQENWYGSGAGFGLRIAQNVASAHGGTVLVQPNPEGGLTVVLSLEVDEQPLADAPVRSPCLDIENLGGHNRYLTELSDVLDDAVFDTRNL